MAHILIVEDDELLNSLLKYALLQRGHSIVAVKDLKSAQKEIAGNCFSLAVLDVNLPDGNGFKFYENNKDTIAAPTIFFTVNDMESDMIKGYELGAEDYITKPFPIDVFLRKVAVILKRNSKSTEDRWSDGILDINFSKLEAFLKGEALELTTLDFQVLKFFTGNPDKIQTREVLLNSIWQTSHSVANESVYEHAITAEISRLRSKIKTEEQAYIKTVYGLGYVWTGGVGLNENKSYN